MYCKGVTYIDDILITRGSEEDHLKTLALMLARLDNVGIQLRKSKYEFMQDFVTYLGHRIDQHDLHPLKEKFQAVQEAPAPKNITVLKSYVGLLTYYSKFIPNMATTLAPLHKLLWNKECWRCTSRRKRHFKLPKLCLLPQNCLCISTLS